MFNILFLNISEAKEVRKRNEFAKCFQWALFLQTNQASCSPSYL